MKLHYEHYKCEPIKTMQLYLLEQKHVLTKCTLTTTSRVNDIEHGTHEILYIHAFDEMYDECYTISYCCRRYNICFHPIKMFLKSNH